MTSSCRAKRVWITELTNFLPSVLDPLGEASSRRPEFNVQLPHFLQKAFHPPAYPQQDFSDLGMSICRQINIPYYYAFFLPN
jgi:hypothetical protein